MLSGPPCARAASLRRTAVRSRNSPAPRIDRIAELPITPCNPSLQIKYRSPDSSCCSTMWTSQAAGSPGGLGVNIVDKQLESGDLYLICSDGLHGVIGNSAIRSILGAGEFLERTAVRLKEAARAQGGLGVALVWL